VTDLPDAPVGAPAATAWAGWVTRVDALARRLASDSTFPHDPDGEGELFLHVSEQLLCWLEWAVGYSDPAAPRFQRQNDLVTPWGGPNADNVYRHARISPRHEYRLRGRMHSCDDFALAIRAGFRHTDRPATLAELTASDIGIGPERDFEVLLGGRGDEANRVPIPDGAIMCSIREYYFDWQAREAATFTIERVDDTPPSIPPTFGETMNEAADLTERSLVFWNEYMRAARERQTDNSFGGKVDVPRGLQLSQFGFCFFDLAPGEALVVDCEVPDARYWSFQLYGMHFFRPLDIGRVTSLNHAQAQPGPDGRVQLVVAAEDPGVPNWLDTMGRRTGLLNYRHFWGRSLLTPNARVMPTDEVRLALPPGTAVVDAAARARQVALRRGHLAWRFRT
jgi:hypothetical protein